MTLTIELPPATERLLRERAERAGKPAAELAADAVRRWLDDAGWEGTLAPFRRSFAESGLSGAEFEAVVDQARWEVWTERPCAVVGRDRPG